MKQAEAKLVRPDFRTQAPQPPARSDDLVEQRLAEELDYVRRLICAVGDELSEDAMVLARHPLAMQTFDVVAQIVGHLSAVVASADKVEAIGRIGMTELRGRLMRSTDTPLFRHDSNTFSAA